MGPKIETSGELLRSMRMLLGIKQIALQHGQSADQLPYAVASLLTEIVAREECRASDLAHRRVVDASVISRQVAQLEHAGLITRRPDPDDRRVSLLRATEQGQRTVHELERGKAQWLGTALQDWDDDQVRELARLLNAAMRDVRRHSCPEAEDMSGERFYLGATGGSTADGAGDSADGDHPTGDDDVPAGAVGSSTAPSD